MTVPSSNLGGGLGQYAGLGQYGGMAPQSAPFANFYQALLSSHQSIGVSQEAIAKSLPHEMRGGEIIAWRCWWVGAGPTLGAMAANYVWPFDKPAEGDVRDLGVHAFKEWAEVYNQYGVTLRSGRGDFVVGKVLLWGDVIEHEKGYRAQYGRVYEIVDVHAEKKPANAWWWLSRIDRKKEIRAEIETRYLDWRKAALNRGTSLDAHGNQGEQAPVVEPKS